MRRRAADFRRPVRRKISNWIWAILGLLFFAGIFLFAVQHNHIQDQVSQSTMEKDKKVLPVRDRLNFTEELLSSTSLARQLSDQMTLAKAYVVIAKEHNHLQLAWELSSRITTCQLLLSKATMRGEPLSLDEAEPIIKTLSSLIFKAQYAHYDIATTIAIMKSLIQALEEHTHATTVQSTIFGQLAYEALPKSLHCLNIKLISDWLKKPLLHQLAEENKNSPRLLDNNLYHFCIFSDNLLGVSVVVNSTVSNADHPKQFVFHVVTNGINYGPMQAWFFSNDFKGATIEVQNVEEFTWLNSPVIKQLVDPGFHAYYFSGAQDFKVDPEFRNPKYLSGLNHLRFYIPDIYS